MIKVLKGGLVTLVAGDEDIVPMEVNDSGDLVPAGRSEFILTWVSGTIKFAVGRATSGVPGYTQRSLAAAGDKAIVTASPNDEDNWPGNIRASGAAATMGIDW